VQLGSEILRDRGEVEASRAGQAERLGDRIGW
jgi:hypothetical protein